jgi:hypothetical protein
VSALRLAAVQQGGHLQRLPVGGQDVREGASLVKQRIPTALRVALRRRAGGLRCEICLLRATVFHVSHRIASGAGGSDDAHDTRLANVIQACVGCHLRVIEKFPALAYAKGWKVRHGFDVLTVPVWVHGGWHLLDDDGGVIRCPAPANAPT